MERALLEQIAFDRVTGGMEYNGMDAEVWVEIKEASDEDLIRFITEN